ncbi:MAG: ABC transporter permease [Chloroflexota bacterium]|nr:ABC transporter permease [Chloroflexota bacterium]
MIGASFAAEMLKLRKRPATWVLGLLWLGLTVLFGYVIPYAVYLTVKESGETQSDFGVTPEQLLSSTLPGSLVPNLLDGFPLFGGAIVLILGALVAGSEFGWGTMKTVLTQRPTRLGVYLGKLLALGAVLLAFVLLIFATGALLSAGIASIENTPMDWPSASVVLRGLGSAWLILAMWASFGVFLGILTRGTALAIGLGLVWAFVLEGLFALFASLVDVIDTLRKAMPGVNAGSLAGSFRSASELETGAPGVSSAVSGEQAMFVLIAYVAAFLAVAGLLLRRRDVT